MYYVFAHVLVLLASWPRGVSILYYLLVSDIKNPLDKFPSVAANAISAAVH